MTDTGFTTAQINRACDDAAWRRVLPLMEAGGQLKWETRTQRAYVDGHGGLTRARLRKLVTVGAIVEAGLDQWVLAKTQNSDEEILDNARGIAPR